MGGILYPMAAGARWTGRTRGHARFDQVSLYRGTRGGGQVTEERGCVASARFAAPLIEIAEESNINDAIAKLVREGLPAQIQQAMDILRVIGNNAVHPGEIQLDEQPEAVVSLFALLNVVVEDRIAQPRQIEEMYETLPPEARRAIARRDERQ
jgi:Domain of unknown function (DUF4145)